MDSPDPLARHHGPSARHHGPSARHHGPSAPASAPPLRRRYSMEEDMFYNHVMTAPQRRPSQPPPYRVSSPDPDHRPRSGGLGQIRDKGKQPALPSAPPLQAGGPMDGEMLPSYQSTLNIEGVFSKKHEIENTTKRAEDRHWHPVFVVLQGTALNIYGVKKDWGWGKTRDGPTISPDNPPWMRKGKLEKTYSLLHADAGIAADYTKRRYVIRLRAETDQFLLSCVELSTFVKWLECLFAAIDIAAPIDDRDFPRDMSIPRVQRIRWFQGQSPALPGFAAVSTTQEADAQPTTQEADAKRPTAQDPAPSTPAQSSSRSMAESWPAGGGQGSSPRHPLPPAPGPTQSQPQAQSRDASGGPPRIGPPRRFSMTNYPNLSVDPHTGKWFPEHKWSSAHDLLYAKLCYSNLLFRSPRKSNYIISKGKQWFVDWGTGRMVRVLPPTYGEVDYFGPWQVIHTENFRI